MLSQFLAPQEPMKTHSVLSVLDVLAEAESATEYRFQHWRPTRLTVSRCQHGHHIVQKSWNCQADKLTGKADMEKGRVLPKSPAKGGET